MSFKCQECGYRFRTVRAAERAAFGDAGCPGCGGSDVDLDPGPWMAGVATVPNPAGLDALASAELTAGPIGCGS